MASNWTSNQVLELAPDPGIAKSGRGLASKLSALGVPSFACTPDKFPEMMAAAINRMDMNQWAADNEIVATRA